MTDNACPNCGNEMKKTGNPTAGNTPEERCTDCWWITTLPFGIRPEDQGKNFRSKAAARKAWNNNDD